jgi:hypothetical protein
VPIKAFQAKRQLMPLIPLAGSALQQELLSLVLEILPGRKIFFWWGGANRDAGAAALSCCSLSGGACRYSSCNKVGVRQKALSSDAAQV